MKIFTLKQKNENQLVFQSILIAIAISLYSFNIVAQNNNIVNSPEADLTNEQILQLNAAKNKKNAAIPSFYKKTDETSVQNLAIKLNSEKDKLHPEYGKVKLEGFPSSEELMSLRTKNSRTFKKKDGSFATQQSFGALHYIENGVFHTIENTIQPLNSFPNIFKLDKTDLPIMIDAKSGETKMQLSSSGETIIFGTKSLLQYKDATGSIISISSKENNYFSSNKNAIILNNFWENIDRKQKIDYWQVKTDYILNSKPTIPELEKGSLDFVERVELPDGWQIIKGVGKETEFGWQGNLLIIDDKGQEKGQFELPVFYDSNKETKESKQNNTHSISGTYRFNQEGIYVNVSTIVPLNWLLDEQREYPVIIDPTVSNTYSSGDISTDDGFTSTSDNSGCPGTMNFTIPSSSIVTSIDVSYDMTAQNSGWISEQRSQLRCVSAGGTNEATLTSGVGNSSGTYSYERTGLTIANAVAGGNLNFELHAGRTWSSLFHWNCDTYNNKVDNNSWTITVYFDYTPANTLYSYQNGNWEDPNTWTTDPSGTLSISPAVPGSGDKAVILNGRTVTTTTNNKTVDIVDIQDGSILDLSNTNGHTFYLLEGQGRLKTSATTLPAGNMSAFVDSTGGTIEYYGNTSFTFDRNTFNNLIVNFSNSNRIATIGNDFIINGDFTIQSGRVRLGNNTTTRTISAYNDVVIESAGEFYAHTQGAHNFDLYGDLTVKNGASFILHNLAAPSYSTSITNGKADLRCLNPTADQLITANGPVEPYWIIIDKGTDQTYTTEIQASGDFFKLYGHTYRSGNSSINLQNGTLKLGANIVIPQFMHSTRADYSGVGANDGQFSIPESCHLWIDGANLTTTNIGGSIYRGDLIFVYGKLTVSSGSLYDNSHRGIILARNGFVQIDGGSVSTSIIRSAWMSGVHRGTFMQTDGTVEIRRDIETTRANGADFNASFMMAFEDNVFQMTGGALNILNSTIPGDSGAEFSLILGMKSSNVISTGGEINITVPDTRDARILSTGSLSNLKIIANINTQRAYLSNYAGYTGVTPAIAIQTLTITNDLTIESPARFDATDENITIGGDFEIESGATYIPGDNTTIFNGSTQSFLNNGTITSGLYNLEIINNSILNISADLSIRNNLTTEESTIFRDMGFTVNVANNIVIDGSHQSQASGSITLNGTGDQTITANGTIGNLGLNKTSGTTTASSDIEFSGNLRLANTNAIFNILSYKLNLASNSRIYDDLSGTSTSNFSSSRMIQTNGSMSDGGINAVYDATGVRTYPIGIAGIYTPASVTFNTAPSQWGSIAIKPVNNFHPLRTSDNAIEYYWKVTSQDFTGINVGDIELRFTYDDSDINGTESNYVPGIYTPISWAYTTTDKVTELTNEILIDNVTNADGEYTAGETDAFGVINTYYSWQTGNWETTTTWSTDEMVFIEPATPPTASCAVIIRDGHTVTMASNSQTAGYLLIESNAVLDLVTTTGHNFGALENGKVSGNGLLRISSATATAEFPDGDFGEFLGEDGGTVEYYRIGTNFVLPNNGPYNYYNLTINSPTNRIDQPNYSILINNNFEKTGNGRFRLLAASSNTIEINGNLNIVAGALQFNNNAAQTIRVKGNIVNSGTIEVRANNAATNIVEVYGDIINEGILDLYTSAARNANLYFLGSDEQTLSGSGATTDFNRIYVDKGASQSYAVNVTSSNFTINTSINQALTITNGTIIFNGPTATISGATAFNIPETGCLNISGGVITVGSNNNDADIILAGKLAVEGGTLNIGTGTNNNNDIEITGAGAPEIDMSGGTINVHGQIRRSITSVAGALNYQQSGGDLYIYGRNRQNTRALLEVMNPGSNFEITGGSINLINGGGTTFGDLYLDAETYSVTGGTIITGNGATSPSSNTFNLYLANPVYNLTVDGQTNAKTAILRSFPATIYGSLIIGGPSQSIFDANSLNVEIQGDLLSQSTHPFSSYNRGSNLQVTIFSGLNQNIYNESGNSLRFGELVINLQSGGTINLPNYVYYIYGNLYLQNGSLEQSNSSNIMLLKDLYISNSFNSIANDGSSITFRNLASIQNIFTDGSGSLGRVHLYNPIVSLHGDLIINNNLYFSSAGTDCKFLIGDKNLSFAPNAALGPGAYAPGTGRYIQTNGALSDAGISKEWGATGSFTYPIGVDGKYTPVTINVSNNGGSNGSINIKPINGRHPSTENPLNDELQYYWNITSDGFGASPTVTHTYNYLDIDVTGTETDYVTGRFLNYQWNPDSGIPGTVDNTANTITLTTVNYIDGEYTAGNPANFISKPPLYSITSGNWEDGSTWSLTSGGATCNCNPNGNPVFIEDGHTVTTNSNGAYAYSVDIASTAILDVQDTREHSLGHVTGSGTIKIDATSSGSFIFPGGYFDEFMNTSGSTVEYSGTGTLPSAITTYQNIVFSEAASTKNIPAIDITVLGNLNINQGYLDNSGYNRDITVGGNWTSNTTGGFIAGRGMVTFNGLNSTINSNGGETFYNLRVNRANASLALASPVEVTHYLNLSNGYIFSDAANLLTLSWSSGSAVIGGGSNSFVDGPLRKMISSGSSFYFPVGDDGRYGRTRVFSTSTTGYWTSQYYNVEPPNRTNLAPPLQMVSNNEYWTISGPALSSANVQLRWDADSDIIPLTALGRQKLRVAQYLSSNWTGVGSQITDGGVNSGTIRTTIPATTSTAQQFTIGLDETATAVITGTDDNMCDDGTILPVAVELTGDGPWDLVYTINGANNTTINDIGSSPYTILFEYGDLYPISGATDYLIELASVNDATGSAGVVLSGDATITLNATPNPIITGADRVLINASETYSVQLEPNETYSWTSSLGIISGASNQRTVTINWGAITGNGWVEVEVTNSVTSCSRIERLDVEIRDWPVISGEFTVCANGINTYSTPSYAGHSYAWSVVGGSITSASNQNVVTVQWGTEAAGSITIEQTDASMNTETDTRLVTINNTPNTWSGAANEDWDDVNNWSCDCLPHAEMDVLVENTAVNMPVINNLNIVINGFEIENGADLRLQTNASLLIRDEFELAGLVNTDNTSYVQLGTDASNIGTYIHNNGSIEGEFRRWVSGTGTDIIFPMGTSTHNRWITMNYTTAPTAGIIDAKYVTGDLSSVFSVGDLYGNLPITEGSQYIDNFSERGLWSVSPSAVNGVSGGTYNIKFLTHGISEIADPATLRMIKRSEGSDTWITPGTHGGIETVDAGSYTYWVSRTGVSTFSFYALAGDFSENPLPINLAFFKGKWVGDAVELSWETLAEINNDYFILERSSDSKNFEEIATIKGNGTTSQTSDYLYLDEGATNANNYYRLTQVDFDGQSENLGIVCIKASNLEDNNISIYPQPVSDFLNIELDSKYQAKMNVVILNSIGVPVIEEKWDVDRGSQIYKMNTSSLKPGSYILQISNETESFRKLIIKN